MTGVLVPPLLGASRPPQPPPSPDRPAHPLVTPLVRSLARSPLRPRKVKMRRRWVESRAILQALFSFPEIRRVLVECRIVLTLSHELFPRRDTRDMDINKCMREYVTFFFNGERDYLGRSKLHDVLKISLTSYQMRNRRRTTLN